MHATNHHLTTHVGALNWQQDASSSVLCFLTNGHQLGTILTFLGKVHTNKGMRLLITEQNDLFAKCAWNLSVIAQICLVVDNIASDDSLVA
jgi:hypothetical protein